MHYERFPRSWTGWWLKFWYNMRIIKYSYQVILMWLMKTKRMKRKIMQKKNNRQRREQITLVRWLSLEVWTGRAEKPYGTSLPLPVLFSLTTNTLTRQLFLTMHGGDPLPSPVCRLRSPIMGQPTNKIRIIEHMNWRKLKLNEEMGKKEVEKKNGNDLPTIGKKINSSRNKFAFCSNENNF